MLIVQKFSVVVVTGSPVSGTAAVKSVFAHFFTLARISAAYVSGHRLHYHNPGEFCDTFIEAAEHGNPYVKILSIILCIFKGIEHFYELYGEGGSGR